MEMNQTEFAKFLGRSQSWVSRLEDPNEPIPTIPTLLSVANKLDIGLKVCFVSFSELLDDTTDLSPETLNVPTFRDDRKLFPRKGADAIRKTVVLKFPFKTDQIDISDGIETEDVPYHRDIPSGFQEVVNG